MTSAASPDQVFVGQTGPATETRVKEYYWHFCTGQTDNLAVAECSFKMENHIRLQGTNILFTRVQCMDTVIKKTCLHLNRMNKEDGLVMGTYHSLP